MERVLLMLKGSSEQEAALDQLLTEQQDPSSPRFHQWLTPEEFGQRFGASSQDTDVVGGWLDGAAGLGCILLAMSIVRRRTESAQELGRTERE